MPHVFRPLLSGCLALLAAPALCIDLQLNPVAPRGDVMDIRNAGDGSGRVFFVHRDGQVSIYRDGRVLAGNFLDIGDRVSQGGERGLLSLAFAPDYASSGFFYTWYTDLQGDTVLSRFRNTGIADLADPNSEQILLTVPQPFANHNGGRLQFGPDGYLYLGLGDGGSGGDPQNNAQNPATLLGKLIRIDVNPVHGTYAVPPDNPFVGDPEFRPEIWALGLRNPWRISFDSLTGDLYIADVGQNEREEINVQPADSPGGENYGWNLAEGTRCFQPGCELGGLTPPVHEYAHDEGCSVIGGEVYRGTAYPGLHGRYFYADYCAGTIWTLTRQGSDWHNETLANIGQSIYTFGQGEDGSIYMATFAQDGVYQLSDGPLVPEDGFTISPSLNDAWVSPGIAGQGMLFTVYPDSGVFFGAWFTYEAVRPSDDSAIVGEAGHRWLTIQGDWEGRVADLDIYLRRGGVFDAPMPVPEPELAVGNMRIEFHGCDSATVDYHLDGVGSRQFAITRLAKDGVSGCEQP